MVTAIWHQAQINASFIVQVTNTWPLQKEWTPDTYLRCTFIKWVRPWRSWTQLQLNFDLMVGHKTSHDEYPATPHYLTTKLLGVLSTYSTSGNDFNYVWTFTSMCCLSWLLSWLKRDFTSIQLIDFHHLLLLQNQVELPLCHMNTITQ